MSYNWWEWEKKRFWFYVKKTETCWIWTGPRTGKNNSYGTFRSRLYKWRNVNVHRYAYELLVGDIPKWHDIHHICGNKLCVNPDHLKAVSTKEHKRIHREESV